MYLILRSILLLRLLCSVFHPLGSMAVQCTRTVVHTAKVIGSSLGVLAAHAGGESSQTPQELMYLLVLSVVAAAVMAAISSWLVGDMLEEVRTSAEEGSQRRASLHCLLLVVRIT